MGRALDTLTRFVMLVLAGLVSLSIIGAIASMSSGGGPGEGAQQSPLREVVAEAQPQPEAGNQAVLPGNGAATAAGGGEAVLLSAPPEPRDETAKWLEAIAYALMAIVGLLALIALILWRGLRDLRGR